MLCELINGERCNRRNTLEFAIQSFVASAVNADVSRYIKVVRASQVSYQVVQVSSCPANTIGRRQTNVESRTPVHLQLAHFMVGLENLPVADVTKVTLTPFFAGKCFPALSRSRDIFAHLSHILSDRRRNDVITFSSCECETMKYTKPLYSLYSEYFYPHRKRFSTKRCYRL